MWRILNEVCVAPLPSARVRAEELACAERLPVDFEGWFSRCVDRDASKRFADAESGIEVLATKGGAGSLSLDGQPLALKDAKPLPSSD